MLAANSGWTRLEVSYTASAAKTLTARLLTTGAGTIYMDCVQVEKAPTASRYNLIQNGDFRTTTFWSSSSGRTTSTAAAPELSTNVYRMTGSPTATNRIYQTVAVSGKAGDTFVLAGWAKGDSASLDNGDTNPREFGIIATFNNTDGTTTSTTVRFNPYVGSSVNWQYAAAAIVAAKTLSDCEFPMSVIPDYSTMDAGTSITDALAVLERTGVKTYFAGSTWEEIGRSIVSIIETGLKKPTQFQRRAQAFSFDKIRLNNEYDFQNFIHLLLRPIFPDIESENTAIKIDGSKKIADFGVGSNKIIVEAKYIDTKNKKAEVIKTLEGLKNFYSENPNVQCLVFLVLYEKTADLDPVVLQTRFAEEYSSPVIYVSFLENPYRGV